MMDFNQDYVSRVQAVADLADHHAFIKMVDPIDVAIVLMGGTVQPPSKEAEKRWQDKILPQDRYHGLEEWEKETLAPVVDRKDFPTLFKDLGKKMREALEKEMWEDINIMAENTPSALDAKKKNETKPRDPMVHIEPNQNEDGTIGDTGRFL